MKDVRIGLIGDHNPEVLAHRAIPKALELAGRAAECRVVPEWLSTPSIRNIEDRRLPQFHGLWCVPATPYASMDGAIGAIRFAREHGTPFLGTCGGFQHALIEYARNVLHMSEADHAETRPDAVDPVISRLSCSLVEVTGMIRFVAGSRIAAIYGRPEAVEGYHCNYGLNPTYRDALTAGALRLTAHDVSDDPRGVELESHPFYLATLYQPERSALRGESHPLIVAFVAAADSAAGQT